MGNIVSDAIVGTPPAAAPSTPPAAQPTQPQSGSSLGIEGLTPPAEPQTGFNVDPFGPSQNPPALPVEESAATNEPPSITPPTPPAPTEQPPITVPTEPSTTEKNDAASILSRMPSITQMMKDLEKSGCLLPELNVQPQEQSDSTPLAALQPQRLKDKGTYFASPSAKPAQPLLPEVRLASSQTQQVNKEIPLFVFAGLFSFIQAAQGIVQALYFMKITYPTYEQKVITGLMSTTEVNALVIKAIIIGTFAVLGGVIALFILIKRTKNSSFFLYFAIGMIILNFCTQNILGGKEFVSGNPLALPEMLSEIISKK